MLTKITVEGVLAIVIILNSLFSSLQTLPELAKKYTSLESLHVDDTRRLRGVAFVQSAVSLVAWYALVWMSLM